MVVPAQSSSPPRAETQPAATLKEGRAGRLLGEVCGPRPSHSREINLDTKQEVILRVPASDLQQ